MTLADYLNKCEYQATHVLVSVGAELPHEEVHPMSAPDLALYRQVWTETFYADQQLRAAREKAVQTTKSTPKPSIQRMRRKYL